MKFSEFTDLLLARLYDAERESGPGKFFSLNLIADDFRQGIPAEWIFDAGKILEARMWAKCIFLMGGICNARLTGEGRLYVEERQENRETAIGQYVLCPENFFDTRAGQLGARYADQRATAEDARKPVFERIEEIISILSQDNTIDIRKKQDHLADLDAVKAQLRKQNPDRSVLAYLLEPVSGVASVSGPVMNLIEQINV